MSFNSIKTFNVELEQNVVLFFEQVSVLEYILETVAVDFFNVVYETDKNKIRFFWNKNPSGAFESGYIIIINNTQLYYQ